MFIENNYRLGSFYRETICYGTDDQKNKVEALCLTVGNADALEALVIGARVKALTKFLATYASEKINDQVGYLYASHDYNHSDEVKEVLLKHLINNPVYVDIYFYLDKVYPLLSVDQKLSYINKLIYNRSLTELSTFLHTKKHSGTVYGEPNGVAIILDDLRRNSDVASLKLLLKYGTDDDKKFVQATGLIDDSIEGLLDVWAGVSRENQFDATNDVLNALLPKPSNVWDNWKAV